MEERMESKLNKIKDFCECKIIQLAGWINISANNRDSIGTISLHSELMAYANILQEMGIRATVNSWIDRSSGKEIVIVESVVINGKETIINPRYGLTKTSENS